MYRLQDSRIGRAWMAIREDELAAAANGINTVTTKLAGLRAGRHDGRVRRRPQRVEADHRRPGPVPVHGLVHGPGDGRARRDGQHRGVALGAFVLYNDPGRPAQAAQRLFEGLNVPILQNIDFVKYQYLLLRHRPGPDDAVPPEGLFPSQRRERSSTPPRRSSPRGGAHRAGRAPGRRGDGGHARMTGAERPPRTGACSSRPAASRSASAACSRSTTSTSTSRRARSSA